MPECLLFIGCERHVERLLEVNRRRLGSATRFSQGVDDIEQAISGYVPTKIIYDEERVDVSVLKDRLRALGLEAVPAVSLQERQRDADAMEPMTLREFLANPFAWECGLYLLALVVAICAFVIHRLL